MSIKKSSLKKKEENLYKFKIFAYQEGKKEVYFISTHIFQSSFSVSEVNLFKLYIKIYFIKFNSIEVEGDHEKACY